MTPIERVCYTSGMTNTARLQSIHDGLMDAYRATGADEQSAHKSTIWAMARHEPTLELARKVVAGE